MLRVYCNDEVVGRLTKSDALTRKLVSRRWFRSSGIPLS